MNSDARANPPWWADYNGRRLVGFFTVAVAVCGFLAGLLRGFLIHRFGWPDWLMGPVFWAFCMALPLLIVLRMRKTGRDRWLLRTEKQQERSPGAKNI